MFRDARAHECQTEGTVTEEKERRKMEIVRRFARARDNWREVTEGLAYVIRKLRDKKLTTR